MSEGWRERDPRDGDTLYSLKHVSGLDRECVFFFFQAEDGIRDLTVTGVQTCALPISIIDNADRAVISGSRAALSMIVLPLASTAAVMRFSVAPTLGNSSTIRAPLSTDEIGRASCRERV